MIAYYLFYMARILSLLDTFIYILQKKPINTFRVISGVFNGIAPTWVWVMVHFGNIPGYDFELTVYALTHSLIYLYYFLVTAGNKKYLSQMSNVSNNMSPTKMAGFRRYRRYKQHLTTWQLTLFLMSIIRRCCAIAFGGFNGIKWEATPQILQLSTIIFCMLLISHIYLYMSLYVTIDERLFVI